MILAVFIAILFVLVVFQFLLASTFIVGTQLLKFLFLLISIVLILYFLPNVYGFCISVFLYAITHLLIHLSKKIAKHY